MTNGEGKCFSKAWTHSIQALLAIASVTNVQTELVCSSALVVLETLADSAKKIVKPARRIVIALSYSRSWATQCCA